MINNLFHVHGGMKLKLRAWCDQLIESKHNSVSFKRCQMFIATYLGNEKYITLWIKKKSHVELQSYVSNINVGNVKWEMTGMFQFLRFDKINTFSFIFITCYPRWVCLYIYNNDAFVAKNLSSHLQCADGGITDSGTR